MNLGRLTALRIIIALLGVAAAIASRSVLATEEACITSGAVADPANNPGLVSDCAALLAARDKLAGTAALNWSADTPITEWDGVWVAPTRQRVTQLNLFKKNLTGEIPPELGKLSDLHWLGLSQNQLTGNIPPELGNLRNLRRLYLLFNQLTGDIPPELSQLANLEQLWLERNQLVGEIPPELGNLRNLRWLSLGVNTLTGGIPEGLGNLSNLVSLELGSNALKGKIPKKLGNLSKLRILSLVDNQLTGEIPVELGDLASLQELSLGFNQLEGEIPKELTSLSNLTKLRLDSNRLTGKIPAELENLRSLRVLNVAVNSLTGGIPESLGNLSNLTSLELGGNELKGRIPKKLGSLSNLEHLSLSDSQLTGEIPVELGDLTNLRRLWLNFNQLEGEIPVELGNLSKLEELGLHSNRLMGLIPTELGNLSRLNTLFLGGNRIPGCIPDFVRRLSNLRRSDLYFYYLPECTGFEIVHSVGEGPQVYSGNVFVLPVAEDLADLTPVPVSNYAGGFFDYFSDDFDFLFFVSNLDRFAEPSYNSTNYYAGVRNNIRGIGLSSFSIGKGLGSDKTLQGVIRLAHVGSFSRGPTLHELMHRWANYAAPTSFYGHWGFSSANGQLGGFDIADLVDHGDGRYSAGVIAPAGVAANWRPYSPIELYLAGFISPDEVPDLWVAEGGEYLLTESGRCVRADNGDCIFTASRIRTYTIEDIVAEHGERTPDHTQSQRDFRAAAVLLIDKDHPLVQWQLDAVSAGIAAFSHSGADEDDESYNFYEATGGRATLTMDGLSQFLKDIPTATLPGVPSGLTATGRALPGIDLSWSAPASDGGSEITAYDLRYIETAADETVDTNWTVEEDVWTTGDGALEYTLTGLTADTEYDLQLRAVNAEGDGPWSATVTGTPTSASTCDTGSAVSDPANNPGLVSVCESLLTLLDALADSSALNWSADVPISEWDGIEEDSLEGSPPQVVKLYLGGFGMDGTIPSELSGLTELKELYLNDNDLSGPIPPELGELSNLTHVHLQNNDLTGPIPAELGDLAVLRELRLDSNDLTGQLPAQLGKLTRVTRLWVSDNDLSGPIPAELGDMASLDWLNLGRNNLSGHIPAELGNLSRMRRLYIHENDLSGPIPVALGSLSRLTHIVAQANNLSGEIPVELGSLENLVWLGLHDNDLTGEIPAELGSLAKLQRLYLTNNELYGELPEELGDLSALTNLWLNHNYLSGQIPQSLDNLENLSRLRLAGNRFSGCLPEGLAAVSNSDADQLGLGICASPVNGATTDGRSDSLGAVAPRQTATGGCAAGGAVSDAANNPGLASDCEALLAARDALEGASGNAELNWSSDIPISEWSGIGDDSLEGTPRRVTRLYLNGLGLGGTLPSGLSGLTALKELYLHDNDLSGTIPPELGDLSNLILLHLQNNDLTGHIPAELGDLSVLRELRLDSNDLTGQLPPELGKLTRAIRLWVSDNDLSGPIPAEIGDMANLDWLNLGRNNFSGQIPTELGDLSRMRRLYIYENDLSGPIPGALGGLSRLTHMVAQGNDLGGGIPMELGSLSSFVWLGLHDNDLTGEIPAELGGLSKLQRLYLTNNELYGEIPGELGDLAALTNLRGYCQAAIDRELTRDEANGLGGLLSDRPDHELFAALQQDMFGAKTLPGNSAERSNYASCRSEGIRK